MARRSIAFDKVITFACAVMLGCGGGDDSSGADIDGAATSDGATVGAAAIDVASETSVDIGVDASDAAIVEDGAAPTDVASDTTPILDAASDAVDSTSDGADSESAVVDISHCNIPFCSLGNDAGAWKDTDGDGLSDAWETPDALGNTYVDMNCNGKYDGPTIDLPLPGADKNVKDIYVRYDYMVGNVFDYTPPPKVLTQVQQAFSAHAINLHWIAPAGPIAWHKVVTRDPSPTMACAGADFVTMKTLRAAAFAPIAANLGPNLQHPAYHYLVFAHNATTPDIGLDYANCPLDTECGSVPDPTSSGSADIFGDDVIVALGYYFDNAIPFGIEGWAGTTLHEIGHNLGLEHGSLAAAAPQTCLTQKPNYVSVMGYTYQFGIQVAPSAGSTSNISCVSDADCGFPKIASGPCSVANACHCTDDQGPGLEVCYRIDYEGDQLLNLDEGNLNELVGVGGPSSDVDLVQYFACGVSGTLSGPGFGAINWNNKNGSAESNVQEEIDGDNPNCKLAPVLTQLKTTTDWDKLKFSFQCSAAWGAGAPGDDPAIGTQELGGAYAIEHHIAHPSRPARIDVRPCTRDSGTTVPASGRW